MSVLGRRNRVGSRVGGVPQIELHECPKTLTQNDFGCVFANHHPIFSVSQIIYES